MPFTREEQEKYIAEREKEGYTQEEADFFSWLADEYGWFKAWRIELEYPPWMLGEPGGIQDSDYWKYWESIGKPRKKEEEERPLPPEGIEAKMPKFRMVGEPVTAEGLPIEIAEEARATTISKIPQIVSIGGYDFELMYDPETGEPSYALIGKTTEPEDEGMTEFEREQLALWGRQAEEEKRQAKLEETRWYTQFFETQQQEMYRRQQEGQLAEERGRERMMGERQSIMQLALEREQILAELKAHPRNWIEAAMFGMGSKPYGMSQISPGWGATPARTPAPTGQMGVK